MSRQGYEYQTAEAKALLRLLKRLTERIGAAVGLSDQVAKSICEAPAEAYLKSERDAVMDEMAGAGKRGQLL